MRTNCATGAGMVSRGNLDNHLGACDIRRQFGSTELGGSRPGSHNLPLVPDGGVERLAPNHELPIGANSHKVVVIDVWHLQHDHNLLRVGQKTPLMK